MRVKVRKKAGKRVKYFFTFIIGSTKRRGGGETKKKQTEYGNPFDFSSQTKPNLGICHPLASSLEDLSVFSSLVVAVVVVGELEVKVRVKVQEKTCPFSFPLHPHPPHLPLRIYNTMQYFLSFFSSSNFLFNPFGILSLHFSFPNSRLSPTFTQFLYFLTQSLYMETSTSESFCICNAFSLHPIPGMRPTHIKTTLKN